MKKRCENGKGKKEPRRTINKAAISLFVIGLIIAFVGIVSAIPDVTASSDAKSGINSNVTDVTNTGVLAASPPQILWQKTFDDPEVIDVAIDSNDNIIVTGDEYIAKYDSSGNESWTIEFYDDDADFEGVAVDPSDNIIVAGELNDDILIVKYTPSGTKLWHKTYDFQSRGWDDEPHAVAVDSSGDIIAVGESAQDSSPWEQWYIVLKVSGNNGNFWWDDYYAHDPPGSKPPYGEANDVVVDSNDNVIVTGGYKYYWGFYDDWQMLTRKYKPDGDRLCSKHYGTIDCCYGCENRANTVTVDHQDNFIIGGYSQCGDSEVIKYNSGCNIQWEIPLYEIKSSPIKSDDEILLASSKKISMLETSDGNEVWRFSYISGYSMGGVEVDSHGDIIAAGYGSGAGIIVKYGAKICGDVNDDRTVNVLDVLGVYRRALDPDYQLKQPWAADVNCDGNINVLDVLGVYRHALDPDYDLNCCCDV